jgi:signal peptidase II
MRLTRFFRTLIIVAVLIANISCDQLSKTIVRNTLSDHEQISLLNEHLTLTRVENSGAFLSLGHSMPLIARIILLSLLPALVLGAGLFFIFKRGDVETGTLVGVCFVLGGGIGNIFDRILYGSVTDFLHIDLGAFQTGVFNLADVSIMVGILIVLTSSYYKRQIS